MPREILIDRPDPILQTIGVGALLLYLFVLISRILDVTVPFLHIPMALYTVLVLLAVVSGSYKRLLRKPNLWLSLYIVWMALAIPTSHWRVGSFNHWTNALKIFVFFICFQMLITSWRKLRLAIWTLALGLLTAAILSRVLGDYSTGRLKLEVGTLSDPNDFAMYMVMGLCFWLLLWQTTEKPAMTSFFYLPPILLLLMAFLSTGSRGGLIALVVVFAVWMVHMPPRGKMVLAGALCIMLPLAPFVMSDYVKSRFLTINSVDEEDAANASIANQLGSSVASTESRKALLMQSLSITVAHPVFGIGPGMFPVYTDYLAKQAGRRRGEWQPTHNMLTQISSECGVPALILYLLAVGGLIASLRRIRRSTVQFPDANSMRLAAGYMLMTFYGLLVAGMFLSIAYTTVIYIIASLSIVLNTVFENQLARYRAASVVPAIPAPTPWRLSAFPAPRTMPLASPRLGARART